MKWAIEKIFLLFAVICLMVAPLLGQQERRPASAGAETGRGAGGASTPATAAPNTSTRGAAVGGGAYSPSRDPRSSFFAAESSRVAVVPTPRLEGTSFQSVRSYYEWQDFLFRLRSQYLLDSYYFQRFYRNTEPLVPPQLMKLALRQPLYLSGSLLQAVDELDTMIQALQAGQSVDKKEIEEKTKEIRDLAKKIRQDNSLSFVDRRMEVDLAKENDYGDLGLEAMAELRDVALSLNSQLRSMYSQSTTSTVSVSSLAQPSFESLSKGIEKLAKVIEKSAKRL